MGCTRGARTAAPLWQEANGLSTGPVRHGESVRNAGAPQAPVRNAGAPQGSLPCPQGSPPCNGYGPYEILAVCRHNLWPAVSMELGQDEWLRSGENREQRGPIIAGDHIRVTTVARRH